MSINVLEWTREIGMMRAVGASDTAVQRIVFSALASYMPARSASRLTVREVPAHE